MQWDETQFSQLCSEQQSLSSHIQRSQLHKLHREKMDSYIYTRTQAHTDTHTHFKYISFPLSALQSLYCRITTVSEKKALNKAKVRLLRLGICCDNKSEMIASYRFMNFLPPQSQTSDVYFIKKAFRFFLQFPQ